MNPLPKLDAAPTIFSPIPATALPTVLFKKLPNAPDPADVDTKFASRPVASPPFSLAIAL
jgi:hypothetical protein